MQSRLNIVLLFCLFLFLCGCSQKENHPKNSVSFSSIESAIKAQIKSDEITKGVADAYFEDDILPEYYSVRLKNISELMTPTPDTSFLEDAVAVFHRNPENSDLIAVLKAKDGHVDTLNSYVKELFKSQQNTESSLKAEKNKIKNNIIKTVGKYVLYITYDKPKKMEKAILDVIQ